MAPGAKIAFDDVGDANGIMADCLMADCLMADCLMADCLMTDCLTHEQAYAANHNGVAPGAKIAFDDVGDANGILYGIPADLNADLFPHS